MKITIRPICLDDMQAIKAIYTNNAVFEHFDKGPWPDRKIEDSVLRNIQRWQNGFIGSLVICLGEDVIGKIAAYPNSDMEHELGYVLHPNHWGKGIAKLAAKMAIDYLVEKASATYVISYVRASNTASKKILIGLNFKEISRQTGEDNITRIKYKLKL